jgi:chemotaxis signal transduction protein
MTTTMEKNATGAADTMQSASFYLGDALMAIPIQQIEEINRHLAALEAELAAVTRPH